jgi:hypothetical protein
MKFVFFFGRYRLLSRRGCARANSIVDKSSKNTAALSEGGKGEEEEKARAAKTMRKKSVVVRSSVGRAEWRQHP